MGYKLRRAKGWSGEQLKVSCSVEIGQDTDRKTNKKDWLIDISELDNISNVVKCGDFVVIYYIKFENLKIITTMWWLCGDAWYSAILNGDDWWIDGVKDR